MVHPVQRVGVNGPPCATNGLHKLTSIKAAQDQTESIKAKISLPVLVSQVGFRGKMGRLLGERGGL